LLNCKIDRLRNPERSLGYARRSVELAKERDPEGAYLLSLAYEQTGNHEQSIAYKNRALGLLSELTAKLNGQ
jgi:tetratricopeptide (TPR) repeat protein